MKIQKENRVAKTISEKDFNPQYHKKKKKSKNTTYNIGENIVNPIPNKGER
jgi:hypothetical protein